MMTWDLFGKARYEEVSPLAALYREARPAVENARARRREILKFCEAVMRRMARTQALELLEGLPDKVREASAQGEDSMTVLSLAENQTIFVPSKEQYDGGVIWKAHAEKGCWEYPAKSYVRFVFEEMRREMGRSAFVVKHDTYHKTVDVRWSPRKWWLPEWLPKCNPCWRD